MSRCQWPEGMEIKPDGVNPLDPCSYDVIEEHHGVTVRVLRCRRCGHQEIEWEDTGRWIPVSERLPDDDDVLVWFEYFRYGSYNRLYQTFGIGTYYAEFKMWTINHESGWRQLRVVAWMPMPEPYEEEKEI